MRNLIWIAACAGLVACKGATYQGDLVDSSQGSDAYPEGCNVLTQTGCRTPDEKCTWLHDQDDPPIGHPGCAPKAAEPKQIGESCQAPPPGPMGYDDCVQGSVCVAGECKQICDLDGDAPTCDENHACTRYADLFESGGNAIAGVCDPGCDPLTQDLKVGTNKTACGSTTPATPTSGCYGFDEYSCAPVSSQVLMLTDRTMPRTNAAGNPYLNGCAPGFIPFFYEMTGSTVTLCTGTCAALEIDNTNAHKTNSLGDGTASAKLPGDSLPTAGHATCAAAYKGSTGSSCRFIWPYLEDDQGMLAAVFENSQYLDTLGVCFSYAQFTYDNDNNTTTPAIPEPDCATLPPRSASTTGQDDDAADWGCQKRANSQFAASGKTQLNGALEQVRLPKHAAIELVRHTFD